MIPGKQLTPFPAMYNAGSRNWSHMSSVASLDAEVEEWRRFNSEFLTIFRKLGEELYHFGKLNVLVIHGVPGTADCPGSPATLVGGRSSSHAGDMSWSASADFMLRCCGIWYFILLEVLVQMPRYDFTSLDDWNYMIAETACTYQDV